MVKRLTLITGGARSGKSRFAIELARQRGGEAVLFVATAQPLDDEMRARIEKHRADRPRAWKTLEASRALARALPENRARVVLVDCVTLWVSNILLECGDKAEAEMTREVDELLAWYRDSKIELIIVTNEVGAGIVPERALARTYRDLLGAVNQKIAAAADHVYLLVAGIGIEIKSPRRGRARSRR